MGIRSSSTRISMARNEDSVTRLESWKGVVTGADPDVIPDDAAPKGQNAVITHSALEAGPVRRRKGAIGDGNIEGDAAVLGLFDYPSSESGRLFLVVTADGGLSTTRVAYELTWADPDPIGYGTPLGASELDAAATVDGTYVYSPLAGTILPKGDHTLHVTFTPDNLSLYSVKSLSQTITVIIGTPVITWGNPEGIIYGTALSGTQLNATADVPGTFVYTPAAGTVLNAGTRTLRVDFTPDDGDNYQSTFAEVTIVVAKATPVITWMNPGSIMYGTALSGTQLNATADVAGAFTYTPPSGTVLNAGAGQQLHVDFVPTDTTNYNNTSDDAEITVNKAWPNITWSNPANITYGTVLSGTQLNATADVPGSFVYTPAAGTLLGAGVGQTLHVDFTPTDTSNYNDIDYSVQITVDKATPVITWAEPADITVGTALDGTQLNASANVAGSFVYDPVSGTVLTVGEDQALDVTFTPTDTDNYTTATATVYIDVTGTQYWKEYWLDGLLIPQIQGTTYLKDKWQDGIVPGGTE